MKKKSSNKLTRAQRSEIDALAALADDEIDTRDIPEKNDWRGKQRGVFYRPVKQQITLRLDADLIAWFKSNMPRKGRGYQTSINRALREYVAQHMPGER